MNNSPQPCCSLCIPFFLPSSFSSSGHNQRMEFLGDSIMQLVATEYLFIHFPDHHEGHLTVRSNHKSSQGLLRHSASLHLCVVFIPSLCFCFLLLTQHEVTAVFLCLCVCVWVIFYLFFSFLSILHINLWTSVCQPRYSTPLPSSSSSACFHKITLFLCSPNTAPACLLYSVWWVLSWDRIVQRFFNNTSLSAHFFSGQGGRGLSSVWKKWRNIYIYIYIYIKLRVCARSPSTACNTGTKQMIGAFETRESIFWQHQMALQLPPLFSQASALLLLQKKKKKKTDCSRPEGIELGLTNCRKEPFAVWYLFVDVLYRWKPWRHLFKSFQPAFRWETESSSNAYAQESRWGTSEMDFISGQKKKKSAHSTSVCLCVCRSVCMCVYC